MKKHESGCCCVNCVYEREYPKRSSEQSRSDWRGAVFPEQLRAHRARLGITQTQLAEILGVSFGAVSKWERGLNLPAEIAQEGAVARVEKLPVGNEG
jgi:DNA-binding XRE family transcriptional regulator